MGEKLHIEGTEISIKRVHDEDYISLTDMAKQREDSEPRFIIRNWMRNNNTILFIEAWEIQNNPDFNRAGMGTFKTLSLENTFSPNPNNLYEMTNSICIVSKAGRYGGTYAHRDVAFEFATWLSPVFKLRLITEFQRLRSEETQRQKIAWDATRELARLNYPIQTAAIAETTGSVSEKKKPGYYAKEADLINELVFGMSAKEWRIKNPDAKGNIRDNAGIEENALIANLESFNSQLIRKGASPEARERALADMLEFQRKILNKKYLPE